MKSTCVSTSHRMRPAITGFCLSSRTATSRGCHQAWLERARVRLRHLAPPTGDRHPRSMSDTPRDTTPGIHHITVGSTGPIEYYKDHIDRLDWLRRFVRIIERFDWKCLIVCQLTTHVH